MTTNIQLIVAPLSQGYEVFCVVDYEQDPQTQLAPAESIRPRSNTKIDATDSTSPPDPLNAITRLTELVFQLNGEQISSMYLGPQLSKRPTIGIQIPIAKRGDIVSVLWRNDQNQQGKVDTHIA